MIDLESLFAELGATTELARLLSLGLVAGGLLLGALLKHKTALKNDWIPIVNGAIGGVVGYLMPGLSVTAGALACGGAAMLVHRAGVSVGIDRVARRFVASKDPPDPEGK
ncbi:MAG: hypothetical protein A2V88_00730 [Elusimicrobia bacterium RBG_16_66_12]|nr:MAG: hypothetical protein A2V88_00730 [Elusimicrobia bacterium RBG_16_66_12]